MSETKLAYNPLYLQVKEVILRRIVRGTHGPGELLPSESRLASDFGTSISTIRQALSLLVADGVLVRKQGKGTIVSNRKVKITFLSWMGESRLGGELLAGVVRKFEAKYPPVTVEVLPTTYPETRMALSRLISEGRAPDVAQIVSHWTSFFASTGAFLPLEDLLGEENIAKRLPDQDLRGGTFQNRLYSTSWGLCPIALIANRTVLRRAGIEEPRSPMSLDEFSDCCNRIGNLEGNDTHHAFGMWYTPGVETDFLNIYPFLQAFGDELVDESGNLALDSAAYAEGFAWMRRFVANTRIFTSDIWTIRRHFAENRIGFILDGPWIRYIMEETTGKPFEEYFLVLQNPVRELSRPSVSWTYNHALAICAQSANRLYAARFVEALTVDPELSEWYCARTGMLPPLAAVRESPAFSGHFYQAFRDQLRHAHSLDARNPMFEKAMRLCVDAVKKILFDGADIAKELAEKQYYLRMLYADA